jgi:hypothetical protein
MEIRRLSDKLANNELDLRRQEETTMKSTLQNADLQTKLQLADIRRLTEETTVKDADKDLEIRRLQSQLANKDIEIIRLQESNFELRERERERLGPFLQSAAQSVQKGMSEAKAEQDCLSASERALESKEARIMIDTLPLVPPNHSTPSPSEDRESFAMTSGIEMIVRDDRWYCEDTGVLSLDYNEAADNEEKEAPEMHDNFNDNMASKTPSTHWRASPISGLQTGSFCPSEVQDNFNYSTISSLPWQTTSFGTAHTAAAAVPLPVNSAAAAAGVAAGAAAAISAAAISAAGPIYGQVLEEDAGVLPLNYHVPLTEPQVFYYSVYLLYWYKSTNTDTAAAAALFENTCCTIANVLELPQNYPVPLTAMD